MGIEMMATDGKLTHVRETGRVDEMRDNLPLKRREAPVTDPSTGDTLVQAAGADGRETWRTPNGGYYWKKVAEKQTFQDHMAPDVEWIDNPEFDRAYEQLTTVEVGSPDIGDIHPAPSDFTPSQLAEDAILRYFHYAHLPEKLQLISKPFCNLALYIVEALPRNAERSVALRKLLEAKDAAVRANV